MARPNQLVQAIAEVFDLDEALVRQRAYALRDANLITQERRGRGKGSMTARDAAHLLIATAGASRFRDAVLAVHQHGACKSQDGRWDLQIDGLQAVDNLGSDHSFADFIEAVLLSIVDGSIHTDGDRLLDGSGLASLGINIQMHEPGPLSEVTLGIKGRNEDGATVLLTSMTRRYDRRWSPTFDPPFIASLAGLRRINIFSERAFVALASVLRL